MSADGFIYLLYIKRIWQLKLGCIYLITYLHFGINRMDSKELVVGFTVIIILLTLQVSEQFRLKQMTVKPRRSIVENELEQCTCGVFMSSQFNKTTRSRPRGDAVLSFETEDVCKPCGSSGVKQCINRCLDIIIKHLPKSGTLLCETIDRDCYKEKAYLYIKNCESKWIPTNFSAGKEYCCRDGEPYKCNQGQPKRRRNIN